MMKKTHSMADVSGVEAESPRLVGSRQSQPWARRSPAAEGALGNRHLDAPKTRALWIFAAGGLAGAAALLFGLQSGERAHGAVRRRIREGLQRRRVERAAILADIERRKNRRALEARRQDYP